MTLTGTDLLSFTLAILSSLGGGAILVIACSNWLGKVWANRVMDRERADHATELEKLRFDLAREQEKQRADFERRRQQDLEHLRHELDVAVAHHLRETKEKIEIYRATIKIIADLLSDLDQVSVVGQLPDDAAQRFDRFNRGRMMAYGHMAMLAPQDVMDAFDNLVDQCMDIAHGRVGYEWPEIRVLALEVLNAVRRDIGIDKTPIVYSGRL